MRRKKRIMFLNVESHYGHGVVEGVDHYSRLNGRWQYYLGRDHSPEQLDQARAAMRHWKPDGIIAFIQNERLYQFVKESGVTTVNVTGCLTRDIPSVIADTFAIGQLAAEYFLSSGFRSFAFAAKNPEASSNRVCDGLTNRLAACGFPVAVFTERYKGVADAYWAENRERIKRWLQKLPKPVALMCIHDPMAQLVAMSCEHLGLRVPEQVAIVGIGNVEFYCQLSTPQLSSVDLNTHHIGFEAARLLDRLLQGEDPPDKPILVPPGRLVARQSSDIIAIEDPDIAAAVQYIRDHAHDPTSVKDLLNAVPISRKTLERGFRKFIGHTPREEITRVHMHKALGLLEQAKLTIPQVARQSGYNDRTIFSTIFRRHVGLSPTQYRKRFRINGHAPAHTPIPSRGNARP